MTAWKTEDAVYFEANTEKGAALLEKLSALTEECDDTAVSAQKEKIDAVMDKLPLKQIKLSFFISYILVPFLII